MDEGLDMEQNSEKDQEKEVVNAWQKSNHREGGMEEQA